MQKVRTVFLLNRDYFAGCMVFLLAGLFFALFTSKAGGFIFLNGLHNSALDYFFRILTCFGHGYFTMAICVLLVVMYRFIVAWRIMLAFLASGLLVQTIKHLVQMPRPRTLLGNYPFNHFVSGITHVGHSSFPSGHTASAFALATILALSGSNKRANFFYLAAAILVAYSRIYMGDHFLQDTLAGALIGVTVAVLVFVFSEKDGYRIMQFKRALVARKMAAE